VSSRELEVLNRIDMSMELLEESNIGFLFTINCYTVNVLTLSYRHLQALSNLYKIGQVLD
jgi:hypothetical protein